MFKKRDGAQTLKLSPQALFQASFLSKWRQQTQEGQPRFSAYYQQGKMTRVIEEAPAPKVQPLQKLERALANKNIVYYV